MQARQAVRSLLRRFASFSAAQAIESLEQRAMLDAGPGPFTLDLSGKASVRDGAIVVENNSDDPVLFARTAAGAWSKTDLNNFAGVGTLREPQIWTDASGRRSVLGGATGTDAGIVLAQEGAAGGAWTRRVLAGVPALSNLAVVPGANIGTVVIGREASGAWGVLRNADGRGDAWDYATLATRTGQAAPADVLASTLDATLLANGQVVLTGPTTDGRVARFTSPASEQASWSGQTLPRGSTRNEPRLQVETFEQTNGTLTLIAQGENGVLEVLNTSGNAPANPGVGWRGVAARPPVRNAPRLGGFFGVARRRLVLVAATTDVTIASSAGPVRFGAGEYATFRTSEGRAGVVGLQRNAPGEPATIVRYVAPAAVGSGVWTRQQVGSAPADARFLGASSPASGGEPTVAFASASGEVSVLEPITTPSGTTWQPVALSQNAQTQWGATTITSLTPSDGSAMVSLTNETVIRFSEPVRPETVTTSTVRVLAAAAPVPGRVRVSRDNRTATYFYDTPLPASTEIRVVVDGVIGQDGIAVDGDVDSQPGGAARADFDTLPIVRIPGTRVWGRVFDSYNKNPDGSNIPVVGARIVLDALPDVFAITDETGTFELVDVPAPDFFVTIDGSTATNAPAGTKYATLGKPFHSIPGQRKQLVMDGVPFDIFLPPMAEGDVVALTPGVDNNVGFGPAALSQLAAILPGASAELLARMQVTYPADSAFNEAGEPATRATVIPVDPNRLPAPLPPGISPNLVISIQAGDERGFNRSGGSTNFDVPAPVTFPNTEGLAPGEKSLIWSFDHDAGRWVVIGTGTVSADGLAVVSDPGVGVVAPGWHFQEPGTETDGPPDEPEPPPCLTPGEVARTVYDAGAAAANCFASIAGVDRWIDAARAAESSIRGLYDAVVSLREAINRGDNAGSVRASMQGILATKDGLIGVVDALRASNPISRLTAAAQCAETILATAEGLCGRLQDTEDCNTVGVRVTCTGLGIARSTLSQINRFVAAAERGLGRLALAFLCSKIDQVAVLLGLVSPPPPSSPALSGSRVAASASNEPSNGPIPAEVEGLLGEAAIEADALASEAVGVSGFGNDVSRAVGDLSEVQRGASLLYFEFAGNRDDVDYAISSGGGVIRGRVDGNGQFESVLGVRTPFQLQVFHRASNAIARFSGVTGASGSRISIPVLEFYTAVGQLDADADGLVDEAEFILGTNASLADSDNDGIPDGAELDQGLDPLGGVGFPTGLIASLPLAGSAQGVTAADDFVYVATGNAGLAIVDATQFDNPILRSQIDLEGVNTDVGVDAAREVAVVAGTTKLHFVNLADLNAPVLLRSLDIASRQVEVVSGFAFASTGSVISSVDIATGEVVQRLTLPASGDITGMARDGNTLYAYVSGADRLFAIDITIADDLRVLSSLQVNIASNDVGITAGGGSVWLAGSGLRAVDASNPSAMAIVGQPASGGDFFTARRIAMNGSGRALVLPDGGSTVSIYNTTDRTRTGASQFVTQFATLGAARGVAISRGIGYIATDRGLQVVNYLPFDAQGVAPTVSVVAQAVDNEPATDGLQVLEGSRIPLQAVVTDDVQVRRVEFLVDGEVVFTDVSFPFDPVYVAPLLAGSEARTLQISARATDTGGNVTTSDIVSIQVVPDRVAPTIVSVSPVDGSTSFEGLRSVRVRFSEPVDAARFTDATARILEAGADGEFGTTDDAAVVALREFRNDGQLLQLSGATLPPGRYRLALREAEIFDASGNALGASERLTTFTIVTRPRVADLFDLRGTEIATNTDFTLDGGEIRLGFGPNGSFIGNNRDVGIEFGGVEFVEPDTPLAAFTISYNGLNLTNSRSDGTQFSVTREDISTDSFKGIRIVATINSTIRVERVVGFNVGEQFITIATRLTNISAVTVEGAAILENMDPDQGKSLGLGNRSLNDLSDDQRLVTAGVSNASYPEALTLGLGSFDSRSRATAEGFAIRDPLAVLDSPNDPNDSAEDLGIACAIRLGTLAAGESAFGSMLIVLGRSKADAIATFERFGPLTADAPTPSTPS